METVNGHLYIIYYLNYYPGKYFIFFIKGKYHLYQQLSVKEDKGERSQW